MIVPSGWVSREVSFPLHRSGRCLVECNELRAGDFVPRIDCGNLVNRIMEKESFQLISPSMLETASRAKIGGGASGNSVNGIVGAESV
jgi:hypothetical protein